MKTLSKTKSVACALCATLACSATGLALIACNGDDAPAYKDPVITQYGVTLDANIVMGPMGTYSMASVLSKAYVTDDNGSYSLTLTFAVGEIEVAGIKGSIFVDDAPTDPTTTDGITDGLIGVYKADGTLVTDGIKLTYSSGDDYTVNSAHQNIYYVKSAQFPVDALTDKYDIAIYINSSMHGAQFAKGVRPATVNLDLSNGKTVDAIDGLGVATRGTAPAANPEPNPNPEPEPNPEPDIEIEPEEGSYVSYGAQLNSVVAMGQDVNFTENLLDGVYVTKKNDKYEITLIFTSGNIDMPFGNKMTGFLTSAESVDYNNNVVTPVFGYYDGETLVSDGVTLTYSSGSNYATNKNGSFYYVQSMTFTVDELCDEYILAIYVMAGNDSSVSSMQFPYVLRNGGTCNAILTLDLDDAEQIEDISDLLGVDTLGTVPEQD